MDKITDVKNEFRLRQWTEIISSCHASDQKINRWCEANGVNIKSYYYWLRKIRTKTSNNEMVTIATNHQTIVPVSFKKESMAKSITINTGNISIDIYEGTTKATLENLLNILGLTC